MTKLTIFFYLFVLYVCVFLYILLVVIAHSPEYRCCRLSGETRLVSEMTIVSKGTLEIR